MHVKNFSSIHHQLQILKNTTKALGKQMCYWVKKTCSVFETCRLPKEESAQDHQKAASK